MSTKKVKLQFEPEYNFRLIGIVCTVKDFELCHRLNMDLEFDFEKQNDISFQFKGKKNELEECYFSIFKYQDEIMKRKFHIIENKIFPFYTNENNTLLSEEDTVHPWHLFIPEAKEVTFFLQCFGHWTKAEWNKFIDQIRKINCITALVDLDPDKLKSKEFFLLE